MVPTSRRQPLYDRLVDILRDQIVNAMKPNDLLPSERELTERYGVSRTTVRLALQELENLGLVYRRHGKGTFVTNNAGKTTNLSQTYSFTEQMRKLGREPSTKVIDFAKVGASRYCASRMNLREGDPIYVVKRLRLADGVPMMVEQTHLPVCCFMSLTAADLEGRALYDVIENSYHEKVRVAEEEFFASIVRPEDAHLLGIKEGSPVLDLVRVTYNDRNEVIEFTPSVARADQFKYKISHYRS